MPCESSVKLGDVLLLSEMRRNERTNKSENAVPGGLLFGARFREGFTVSNLCLAACRTFCIACFPFDFVLGLTFCAFLREGAGEGVNVH